MNGIVIVVATLHSAVTKHDTSGGDYTDTLEHDTSGGDYTDTMIPQVVTTRIQ